MSKLFFHNPWLLFCWGLLLLPGVLFSQSESPVLNDAMQRNWTRHRVLAEVQLADSQIVHGVIAWADSAGMQIVVAHLLPSQSPDSGQSRFIRRQEIAHISLRRNGALGRSMAEFGLIGTTAAILTLKDGNIRQEYAYEYHQNLGMIAGGLGLGIVSALARRVKQELPIYGQETAWEAALPVLQQYSVAQQRPIWYRNDPYPSSLPEEPSPQLSTKPQEAPASLSLEPVLPIAYQRSITAYQRWHFRVDAAFLPSDIERSFYQHLPPNPYGYYEYYPKILLSGQVSYQFLRQWRMSVDFLRKEQLSAGGNNYADYEAIYGPLYGMILQYQSQFRFHQGQVGLIWLPFPKDRRFLRKWELQLATGVNLPFGRFKMGIEGEYADPDSNLFAIQPVQIDRWLTSVGGYGGIGMDYYLTDWLSWHAEIQLGLGNGLRFPEVDILVPGANAPEYRLPTRRSERRFLMIRSGLQLHLRYRR